MANMTVGDNEVRVRMAAAEIESILQKYSLQMTVVEVLLDGKSALRNIQLLDKKPITGVQVSFAQGTVAANG